VLADAIAGARRSDVLRQRNENYAGKISPIMAGSWRSNPPKSFASIAVLSQNLADDIVAGLKRFNGFPRTINPGDNSALRVRAPRRKGPITTGFLHTSNG